MHVSLHYFLDVPTRMLFASRVEFGYAIYEDGDTEVGEECEVDSFQYLLIGTASKAKTGNVGIDIARNNTCNRI